MSVNWIVLNIFDWVFVVYNDTIVASKVEITTSLLWEYSNSGPAWAACPRYSTVVF